MNWPTGALSARAEGPGRETSECPDNTWTAISTDGAPTAREHHAAIWTGTEMIIWGGVGQSGEYLDTGARYDPATDTWAPISAVNAPVPIAYPGAVWTGTEMIIWGGYRLGGGRYDPATDTWTPVSTVNAPNGGRGAVWGDTEMMDKPSYSAGGRYDPGSDTWTVMNTKGAPTNGGSIVWTGAEMIVCAQGPANVYNPVSDSWRRASSAGRPSNRVNHTAVWTGTEMIVWGGVSDQYPPRPLLNSGARYCASTGL